MICWTIVTPEEKKDFNAFMKIWIDGGGKITIPTTFSANKINFVKVDYGIKNLIQNVNGNIEKDNLIINIIPELCGRWIYVCNE